MPSYPVNVFHGQLSPSSFRQHPFMEFLWSGGRAGCPLPSAALWPKTIGMPFVSSSSYYQPLMGPDSDIHTVIDQGSSPTNTPSKKTSQWDDFESKFGSVKPKGVSNRHQYLPDFRKAAYYTSAFRPVITSKGCLDPERAFASAERVMFPPKSVPEECFLAAAQDHRCDPLLYKAKHHQVLTQPDDPSKPSSLNHLTRKPILEVDHNQEESNSAVKRTPSSRGSGAADAGADLPDERGECLRERLDLETERPQRITPVAKVREVFL